MTIMPQRHGSDALDSKLRTNKFLQKNLGGGMTKKPVPIPSDPGWDFKTTTISHGEIYEIVQEEDEEDGFTVMTEPTWLNIDGPKSVVGSIVGAVANILEGREEGEEERDEDEEKRKEEVREEEEEEEHQSQASDKHGDAYDDGLVNIFDDLNVESRSILLGILDYLATASEEGSIIDSEFYDDENFVTTKHKDEEEKEGSSNGSYSEFDHGEGNPSVEITFDDTRYTVVSYREKKTSFPLSATELQPSFEVSNILPYSSNDDGVTIRSMIRQLFKTCKGDDQIATIQDFIQRNLDNDSSSKGSNRHRQIESIDSVRFESIFDPWTQLGEDTATIASMPLDNVTVSVESANKEQRTAVLHKKKRKNRTKYAAVYET